jgi:DNA-binding IclR family transcriptional regulator
MAIQEGFRHLSTLDLTGREYRVLAYFMAELDFENFIRVSQTEVAERLGIDRANVSRAVKRFVELDIIHKGPRGPQGWTYQLDPSLGWKGRASRRVVALNERRGH